MQKETFKRNECRGFFSGVLPEDRIRETVARILGISAHNDFAMLEQIGGECAGAITFLPVEKAPLKTDYKYRSNEVRPRDFDLLAKEIGFAVPMVRGRVPEMAGEIIKVIDELEPSNTASKEVMKIIFDRCERVKSLFGNL